MISVRDQQRSIAERARLFAGQAPAAVLDRVAAAIQHGHAEMLSGIGHPHYRTLAANFVKYWTEEAPEVAAEAVITPTQIR